MTVEVLPSQMPIKGYVRVKFRCVCCRRKFAPDGELRKEDVDKLIKKDLQPLCRSCAIQNQKHIDKYEGLEGRLKKIRKLVEKARAKEYQTAEGKTYLIVLCTNSEKDDILKKLTVLLKEKVGKEGAAER